MTVKQRIDPSFDVVFIAFQRLQQLRQGGTVGADGSSHASVVLKQIKLEKCRADSAALGLQACKKQVSTGWITLPTIFSSMLRAVIDHLPRWGGSVCACV
jgi:hypothetical protein